MASVNIKVNLITKAAELQLQKLNTTLRNTGQNVERFSSRSTKSVDTLSRSFRNASIAFGGFGILLRAGLVGGGLFGLSQAIRKSVSDFATFETALVGVSKTTDLAGDELQQFGDEIQQLSLDIPVTATELLRLSQVAAQLGVRGTNNLRKFAETGARLAVSTDLAAEDAVTSLTRILGVTQGSVEDVDRLGAALVELGNTFKAQESEILTAAGRVARATAGFGLTAEQTLAIGAALKEAGVEAESGGSAIGRVFQEIDEAIAEGGQQLQVFTELTGLTADQLKKSFEEDAAGTFKLFIDGIQRSVGEGRNLTTILRQLELGNVRVAATVRSLVQINDRLGDSLRSSNEAFLENRALTDESDKQFDTLQSSITRFNNAVTAIFTNLSKQNSGPLKDIIDNLGTLARQLSGVTVPTSIKEEFKAAKDRVEELRAEQTELKKQLESPLARAASILPFTRSLEDVNAELKTAEENYKNFKFLVEEGIEITTPGAEDGGQRVSPDPENDPRVVKERQVNGLLDLIRQDRQLKEAEAANEEAALLIATQEKGFNVFIEGLGREEAAQVASNARKLVEEGKYDKARDTLRAARIKAEENAAKAQIQLDQRAGLQRASIAANVGQLINAVAGKETKAGFILQQAAAAANIIVQSQIAQAKAIATFPLTLGEPLTSLIRLNTGIQLATVGAQTIAGFQDGGVVPGTSTSGDRVLARVNSGEMILNRAQQSQLFALANNAVDTEAPTRDQVINTTVELDGDVVARAVSKRVADGMNLGEFE